MAARREPFKHLDLTAFYGSPRAALEIVPAPRRRAWMNAMPDRWANRCLPLLVANEAGWVLLNRFAFQATWTGEDHPRGVTIEFADDNVPMQRPVRSHFGSGIITWGIPYLFRTPPGYNLLARGPANWPKDGACALEGIVETDWAVATFTMNWKLTRPGHTVAFEAEEPFCMIVPQQRGEIEAFRPAFREIRSDPSTYAASRHWAEGRDKVQVRKFLGEYSQALEAERTAWEGHYFRGLFPDDTPAPEHQTRLTLPEFEEPDG
jgi:hypothetical protein